MSTFNEMLDIGSSTTASNDPDMQLTTTLPYIVKSIVSAASTAAPLQDAAASTTGPTVLTEHLPHNQITFEIPSHRDLEHINSLHNFNTLLQRIGNVAYDTVAAGVPPRHRDYPSPAAFGSADSHASITSEQISKSVVLDLAELNNGSSSGLERFFAGADMHTIINYLWIGVVTSLVILSVIFIIFSCYFYRKFREWKKCNKDIRSHLHNDMYPGGTIVTCDSLLNANGQPAEAAAYYQQMESPPCYTIATGLPTYDEALHHQQHFSYGMKFVYPSIAAVHHHPAMSGVGVARSVGGSSSVSAAGIAGYAVNWPKRKFQQQQRQCPTVLQQEKPTKVANVTGAMGETGVVRLAPPVYDTACVALLSAMSEKSEAISICLEAPADMTTATAAVAAPTTTTTLPNVLEADSICSDVVVA